MKRQPATDVFDLLNFFITDCELRNLTPKTISVHKERLKYFYRYLQEVNKSIEEIGKFEVMEYILSIRSKVSGETVNGRIRVLKTFFKCLIENDLWKTSNPMENIKYLKTEKKVKPVIRINQVQKIINSLNKKTFEGFRNILMILLFWDALPRRGEIINIKLDDVNIESRIIKVFGKGRKERYIPMGVKTTKFLSLYLIKWRKNIEGDFLLCDRQGNKLKEGHCYRIVRRIGKKNGINLYPHLIRHSGATFFIQQGGSIAILQRIMGHVDISTTEGYLHLSSKDAVNSYEDFGPSNGLRI